MSISRRDTLKVLAGATCANLIGLPQTIAATSASAPEQSESLSALAKSKGINFGSAMGYQDFQNLAYRGLISNECGVLVAENETKWRAVEPEQGKINFRQADEMFSWAKQQGMLVRGHTLIWQPEKWLPDWVTQHNFGLQPALESERLMREHISVLCRHFDTVIYSYDVVNEAVDHVDGTLRSNVLTRNLGAIEQIDLAFRLAHDYAPHAQLVYNDYMRWDTGSDLHRAGVLKLLHTLKSRGVPVHALGIQSHVGSWNDLPSNATEFGNPAEKWRQFLDEVTAMGLDLAITEFDVNDRLFPMDIPTRDRNVAALARDYLDVTLSYPGLKDFLVWGMADNVSWLQHWDEAPRLDHAPVRPCPYDSAMRAKPLRTALAEAFKVTGVRAGHG